MWKIYYWIYSREGKLEDAGIYNKEYKRKGYAEHIIRKVFMSIANLEGKRILCHVGKTNPLINMSFNEYLKLKE